MDLLLEKTLKTKYMFARKKLRKQNIDLEC